MAETDPGPFRPTDDDARKLARALLDGATFCALGVREPETGNPMVSRVAVGTDPKGLPVSLISELSHHTQALAADASCSLLVGEPADRGDPLTHPRLTIQAEAEFVARGSDEHASLRAIWLSQHPKSKLYVDFGDFRFVRFRMGRGFLNGGFGQAYVLSLEDLTVI